MIAMADVTTDVSIIVSTDDADVLTFKSNKYWLQQKVLLKSSFELFIDTLTPKTQNSKKKKKMNVVNLFDKDHHCSSYAVYEAVTVSVWDT
jgi:hypothetical protein